MPTTTVNAEKPCSSTVYFRLLLCLALVATSGCGLREWARNGWKVGPAYCPPVEPVASTWIDYGDPRVKISEADLATWCTAFNDPMLNDLIQNAYSQNLTLREAGARIVEARYQRQ